MLNNRLVRRYMMSLTEVRNEINRIDDSMKKMFDERMLCSNEVAKVKIQTNDKVFKPLREKEICERFTDDEEYLTFVKKVMQISRKRQYGIFIDTFSESTCWESINEDKCHISKTGELELKLKADKTSTKGLNVNDILSVISDSALEIKKLTVSENGTIEVVINVHDDDRAMREALVLAYMLSEETI